jgi:hypothetical protein
MKSIGEKTSRRNPKVKVEDVPSGDRTPEQTKALRMFKMLVKDSSPDEASQILTCLSAECMQTLFASRLSMVSCTSPRLYLGLDSQQMPTKRF